MRGVLLEIFKRTPFLVHIEMLNVLLERIRESCILAPPIVYIVIWRSADYCLSLLSSSIIRPNSENV